MRERLEQILKIICLVFAVVLVVELVKVARHINPLAGVAVPELPTLPVDTNAPPKVVAKGPVMMGTNGPGAAMAGKTNGAVISKHTNEVGSPVTKESESNVAPVMAVVEPAVTNKLRVRKAATNAVVAESASTNSAGTNIAATELVGTNLESTNITAVALAGTNMPGTNLVTAKSASDTNVTVSDVVKAGSSNSVAAKKGNSKRPPPPMPGMMMGGMPGMPKAASLPPEVQARVDRVTDSEIFGPVIRPMPMALLGIAGNVAFIRSPSGQTGLVKEGDSVGEIKLLKIGVNRVLIEQDGQKKELMIFSGFGGETLLTKPTESADETTKN